MNKLDPKWVPVIAVAGGLGGGIASWFSGYPWWDSLGMAVAVAVALFFIFRRRFRA